MPMKNCPGCESEVRARLLEQLGGLCVRCLVRFVIGGAEEANYSSERGHRGEEGNAPCRRGKIPIGESVGRCYPLALQDRSRFAGVQRCRGAECSRTSPGPWTRSCSCATKRVDAIDDRIRKHIDELTEKLNNRYNEVATQPDEKRDANVETLWVDTRGRPISSD